MRVDGLELARWAYVNGCEQALLKLGYTVIHKEEKRIEFVGSDGVEYVWTLEEAQLYPHSLP